MSRSERAGKAYPGKVFAVRIDVELPQEVLDRVERAVQKAVLTELADTDIADGYSVLMRAPVGREGEAAEALVGERTERDPLAGLGGATSGIWVREVGRR